MRAKNKSARQLRCETLENRQMLAGDLPVINEFMASNDATLDDGNGKSPDWLEIYNPTAEPIDLAGWHLTDAPNELDKWEFPAHSTSILDPFEHLVVFASGNDELDPTQNLHTNFKLSAGGDYLALTNPSEDVISEYGEGGTFYPPQTTDTSYGREGAAFESNDIVYIDATAGAQGNTRLTVAQNGSTIFEVSGVDIPNQGNDGQWEQRTFGNNGTIFESGVDSASDNGPALTTFVDGLSAGTYEVFAYIWSDQNNNWDLQLGLEANDLQTFRPTSANAISLASLNNGNGFSESGYVPPVMVFEGNRTLHQIPIGERTVAEGELLEVFVDDVPNVPGRSWYDGIGVLKSLSVVDAGSSASYLIPTNNNLGTSWTEIDFDAEANGFTEGQAAIGFENNPASDTSFSDAIGTTLPSGTASAYLRIPFEVENPETISGVQLDLMYDDGFVAYLNGQPILSDFAPDQLDHTSTATGSRSDGETLRGNRYSLSGFQPLLVSGTNILSFHALNRRSSSTDFLLSPKLNISSGTGSGEIRYFSTPTPGTPNTLGFLGFVADTKFDVDRGFYTSAFDVQITSATSDASIYYTVDGSEPTPDSATSVLYDGAIRISKTTNLRAAAFKDGFRPTNVDTQTYLFLQDVLSQDPQNDADDPRDYPTQWQGNVSGDYEIDTRVVERWSDDNPDNTDATLLQGLRSIPTISLTMDHDELWDRTTGIYPNANQRSDAWRRSGSIEYFDPNSDEEFQYNVGIAMHGNASAFNERLLKHSFRLRFSPEYDGPSKLNFPLFDNSDFDDINQIILRAAFTDAFGTRTVNNRYSPLDSTYLRDVWMRDAQLAAGGTAAQSTYVHLYINGLYWGLYNPAERTTDDQFFASHLGGEEEDWDILKDFNELQSGNRTAWNEMFTISRSIRSSNADEKYFEIQGKDSQGNDDPNRTNYLNMDRFIDYMALHHFAGVEDWAHHNWHASFNRVDPGKGFEFHTWDQEIGLDQLARDRTNANDSNSPAELFGDLRQSPEFRLHVADRIQELFFDDGPWTVDNNQQRWMDRAQQIEQAIIGESARWGDAREGQRVTAYSNSSPLPDGTGMIPTGTQTIPLMTVDHWRDSVTYVNETFFPAGADLYLQRMRSDNMYPDTPAPTLAINGTTQHSGNVVQGSQLSISLPNNGEIYYTLDGSDPRAAGGAVQGAAYTAPLALQETTTLKVRARINGEWSPLVTSTFVLAGVPGDLNLDQQVDSQDIDALFAAVRSNDQSGQYDLNSDNDVNTFDSDYLIENLLQTRRGDFDLNGKVEFADFLVLSASFGSAESVWAEGDANGDGDVSFADFLLVSSNFGFDKDAI